MNVFIKKYLLCSIYFLLLTSYFLLSSCGYNLVGSRLLPFDSITIKQIQNNTYEPRLEERMHNALSDEFIHQGISVRTEGGDVELEAVITTFHLGAVGAVDERVKEQELIMLVDLRLIDNGRATDFKSMRSPIKITFQSTGAVAESVANKETATDRASREIAREIVSRIIILYAK